MGLQVRALQRYKASLPYKDVAYDHAALARVTLQRKLTPFFQVAVPVLEDGIQNNRPFPDQDGSDHLP
ncbi:hypothetical protein D3C74_450850 [compost metagenome]